MPPASRTAEPPRLRVLAYAYEALVGDLLIEPDGSTVEVTAVDVGDDDATLTLSGGDTRQLERGASLDLFRHMGELPEAFRGFAPTIGTAVAEAPAEPVDRLELPAYAFEVMTGDLILDGDERLEVRTVTPADEGLLALELGNGTVRSIGSDEIVTVQRDRQLVPGFEDADPEGGDPS